MHKEKESERRKKMLSSVRVYMLLGSEPFIVLSHIYFFSYEFFTAQLNTIDGCVFDMDLYI